MSAYVAFLRGINVGGKNKIPMAELRKMFEQLGFEDAKTLLQSGNVVFHAKEQGDASLEATLEHETAKRCGVKVDYMIRSAEELADVIRANPFKKEEKDDPSHLLVLFLKTRAPQGAEEDLRTAIKGREVVKVKGREAYAIYPDGIGTSKLTNAVLEKHLGARVTGRNWTTLNKLLDMMKAGTE